MSELLAKQHALFHSISRSLDNFRKVGKNNYTPAKIRSRVSALKETWAQCIETHSSLMQAVPEAKRESVDYFRSQLFDMHEDVYQETLDYMAERLEEIEPPMTSNSANHRNSGSPSAFSLSHLPPISIPPFSDLDRFIASRARALEELAPPSATKLARSQKATSATASATSAISCPLCKSAHFINKCPQFIKKSPTQRAEIIKSSNRCINCLSTKHAVKSCPRVYACRTCQRKHHSMLHLNADSPSIEAASPLDSDAQAKTADTAAGTALNMTTITFSRPHVLLATAKVQARTVSGRAIVVRALIDQGSEITFMTKRLARLLKVRRVRAPVAISGVGGIDAGTCCYAANIILSPCDNSKPVLEICASILKSLTSYAPSPAVSPVNWDHLADLSLADPDLLSADPIDLLLGADLYSNLILEGVQKGKSGQPVAQKTVFGWIISGSTATRKASRNVTVLYCANNPSLDQLLQNFWEIEELPRQTLFSPEEQQCEEHFASTHSRDSNGWYIVRLPFKRGPPIEIGSSHGTAKRLLQGLQRRFNGHPQLKTEYSDFLSEYKQMGHMRTISSPGPDSAQCVYIPHHPVIRESSVTTHLRVVFNASSRTSDGSSLNDHLLAGPKLQTDLAAVILRWKQFCYVYAADIAKMYRQIRVDPRDVDYQRILWFRDDDQSVQAYQLLTVTYGTASALFLALCVLRQLAQDEGDAFFLAVSVLQDHIYVDVLFGADDSLNDA
ncbi:uncharacterized protein [Linepithema humile]|uniref:uncharacterized protein n=1 Tax=Linepithema humile TaxID=83485 RepID=UPI00351E5957